MDFKSETSRLWLSRTYTYSALLIGLSNIFYLFGFGWKHSQATITMLFLFMPFIVTGYFLKHQIRWAIILTWSVSFLIFLYFLNLVHFTLGLVDYILALLLIVIIIWSILWSFNNRDFWHTAPRNLKAAKSISIILQCLLPILLGTFLTYVGSLGVYQAVKDSSRLGGSPIYLVFSLMIGILLLIVSVNIIKMKQTAWNIYRILLIIGSIVALLLIAFTSIAFVIYPYGVASGTLPNGSSYSGAPQNMSGLITWLGNFYVNSLLIFNIFLVILVSIDGLPERNMPQNQNKSSI